MNNKRWQKLLNGGKLTIETPFEESAKQLKYSADAQLEADRLSNILTTINDIGTVVGTSIAGIDFSQIGKAKKGSGGSILNKALVEDGETAYLPTGEILSFSGKEHKLPNSKMYRQDGTPDGISVNLPEGTIVDQKNYTLDEKGNLIKTTKNSVAMQRKALADEENKVLGTFERKLNASMKGVSPADKFTAERLRLSAQKYKEYFDSENEKLSNMTTKIASMLESSSTKKAATGTIIGKPKKKLFETGKLYTDFELTEVPDTEPDISKINPIISSPEMKDALSPILEDMNEPRPKRFKDLLLDKVKNTSVGNLVNYAALFKNLNRPDYASAAYSQANSITNPYKGIGYEAEQTMQNQFQVNDMQLAENLRDIDRALNTAQRRANLSTNSLQEQRALALSSEVLEGEKRRKAILDKLTMDSEISNKLAGLQMQNATLNAQGQADAEMYAKNAIQNLYTQKGIQEDKKITGMQALAEALNKNKEDKDIVKQIKDNGPIFQALYEAGYDMDDIIAMLTGQTPNTEKKEKQEKQEKQ